MASEESPVYQVRDLAGCKVYTEKGDCIGELVDVLPTGGNDVFIVRGAKEILVPALRSVVTRIDLLERRIEVTLPPGLRELYEAL